MLPTPSPAFSIIEEDSTDAVPVQTRQGPAYFVANFAWGPVNTPTLIDTISKLVSTFGNPTDENRVRWHAIADYISSAGSAWVVRSADATARNACFSQYRLFSLHLDVAVGNFNPGDMIVIEESNGLASNLPAQYPATDLGSLGYSFHTKSRMVVHSYDANSNTLNFFVEYDYTGGGASGLTKSTAIREIIKNTQTKTINALRGDPNTIVGSYHNDLIVPLPTTKGEVGSRKFSVYTVDATFGVSTISFTGNDRGYAESTLLLTNGIRIGNATEFEAVKDTIAAVVSGDAPNTHVIARYPGDVGNSIGVLIVQPGFETTAAWRSGMYKAILDALPPCGTSVYATSQNLVDLRDEVHVVVFDVDGAITGAKGTVLETYQNLSVIRGATKNSEQIFFVDVVNRDSKWVYVLDADFSPQSPETSLERVIAIRTDGGGNVELPTHDDVTLTEIPTPYRIVMAFSDMSSGDYTAARSGESTNRILGWYNKFSTTFDIAVLGFMSRIFTTAQDSSAVSVGSGSSASAGELTFTSPVVPPAGSWTLSLPVNGLVDYDNPIVSAGGLTAPLWVTSDGVTISAGVFSPSQHINFPADIADAVALGANAKVTVANLWNGLNHGDTGEVVSYNGDYSVSWYGGAESVSRWVMLGVSGFGADNDVVPANYQDTFDYPSILGSGYGGKTTRDEANFMETWGSIPTSSRIDTIIAGPASAGYQLFLAGVAQSRRAVAFVSPIESDMSPTVSSREAAVAQSAKDIGASEFVFMDSTWYVKYDEYAQISVNVPLCGLTAGLADSKRYPWSPFAGLQFGAYPSASQLLFNADEKPVRDVLYSANVNPVYNSSVGVVLYGDKTMAGKASILNRVVPRRALNAIEKACQIRLNTSLFSNVDSIGADAIKDALDEVMSGMKSEGACSDFSVVVVPDAENFKYDVTVAVKLPETINWVNLTLAARRR